jgi:ribokinase
MLAVLHAGANSHVSPTDTSPDLSTFTHLLIQNEIPLPSTLSHLTSAGRAGLTTIFNPSPMLSPSELRAFPWSDLTWLIVNEGELETLLEAFGAPLETASTTESIRERANQGLIALHKSGDFARTVSTICTLGAQGILFFQPPSRPSGRPTMGYLPAARLLQPLKDATGAGDCFAGYFVAGLMASSKGEGSERILKTCLAVSRRSVMLDEKLMRSGMCYVR